MFLKIENNESYSRLKSYYFARPWTGVLKKYIFYQHHENSTQQYFEHKWYKYFSGCLEITALLMSQTTLQDSMLFDIHVRTQASEFWCHDTWHKKR